MSVKQLIVPRGYHPVLGVRDTEDAIKMAKDMFERELSCALNLQRVSAPLYLRPESGLNDNLNGVERPVAFDIPDADAQVEMIHSLAKWKRMALNRYGFGPGEGLYTDMNAIRRDEELDNLHSVYVDQWDWELILCDGQRTQDYLQCVVKRIYSAMLRTGRHLCAQYPALSQFLPEEITFITSQELLDRYPDLSALERENAITREYGAVFVTGIGGALSNGRAHDGRAPDYDDWSLNGDILVYYPVLERVFELSSMGIRVDAQSLQRQLAAANCAQRASLPFHRDILTGALPLTIGGGIGQSRLCMLFLNKAHIGEVQSSVWGWEMFHACEAAGIPLL